MCVRKCTSLRQKRGAVLRRSEHRYRQPDVLQVLWLVAEMHVERCSSADMYMRHAGAMLRRIPTLHLDSNHTTPAITQDFI